MESIFPEWIRACSPSGVSPVPFKPPSQLPIPGWFSEKEWKFLAKPELVNALYRCQRCGICRTAFLKEKGFERVCPIRENYSYLEPYSPRGKISVIRGVVEGRFDLEQYKDKILDIVTKCTLCGNCSDHCIANVPFYENFMVERNVNHTALFEAFRAELVSRGVRFEPYEEIEGKFKRYRNPYGENNKKRGKKRIEGKFLYFQGCTSSFRTTEIGKSARELLDIIGIEYSMLGTEEMCCGSILIRMGFVEEAIKVMKANAALLIEYGFKTIITPCAGCYKTLSLDFPRFTGIRLPVIHISQLVDEAIKKGRIKIDRLNLSTTYHDPCHLGRHGNVYEEPRSVLKAISNYVELLPSKNNSICCGAGGGVKAAYPELAEKIARSKVNKVLDMGVDVLVSACPFCKLNLKLASKGKVEVKDITEIVLNGLA
jgi:Fe-S oxidoreductase